MRQIGILASFVFYIVAGLLGGLAIGFALATVMPTWAAVLLALAICAFPWGVFAIFDGVLRCSGGCLTLGSTVVWDICALIAVIVLIVAQGWSLPILIPVVIVACLIAVIWLFTFLAVIAVMSKQM